jgi:hypothetical protein
MDVICVLTSFATSEEINSAFESVGAMLFDASDNGKMPPSAFVIILLIKCNYGDIFGWSTCSPFPLLSRASWVLARGSCHVPSDSRGLVGVSSGVHAE